MRLANLQTVTEINEGEKQTSFEGSFCFRDSMRESQQRLWERKISLGSIKEREKVERERRENMCFDYATWG